MFIRPEGEFLKIRNMDDISIINLCFMNITDKMDFIGIIFILFIYIYNNNTKEKVQKVYKIRDYYPWFEMKH